MRNADMRACIFFPSMIVGYLTTFPDNSMERIQQCIQAHLNVRNKEESMQISRVFTVCDYGCIQVIMVAYKCSLSKQTITLETTIRKGMRKCCWINYGVGEDGVDAVEMDIWKGFASK
ncbi:hypothetical protein Taro_018562, partial [Colocasia esculenta]|nr:hypothetical protein [Colocasia esculenta]